jgi:hypothetical protein
VKRNAVAAVIGLLALEIAPAPRAADNLSGTRGPIEERSHVVKVTLAPGHATLVVERTIENLGRRHDQADWSISIPETAVATRLRTRGVLDGKPHWFEGDLMEAEEAAARYKELTGIGGYYPKDPALLSWRTRGELALQVFPVPPAERKTVSYTLLMPTVYQNGRFELTLPPLGAGASADLAGKSDVRPRFDPLAWLREALAPARAKCGFDNHRVALTVETTRAEVVDVAKIDARAPGDKVCLVEAAWSLDLPSNFLESHAAYRVVLGD